MLMDTASQQAVLNGVPENWVQLVQANPGVDQLIAVLFMAVVSFVMALLAFIAATIWSRISPWQKKTQAVLDKAVPTQAQPA